MPPKTKTQIKVQSDKARDKKAKAAEKKERKHLELEERTKFLRKEHLRREIEMGARNTILLRKSWREMMIKIKLPNIKADLEVAWHTFNRVLDIKDYSISLLLDALDNSEEQYQVKERAHIEQIDKFLQIYETRLEDQKKNFQANFDQVLNEFEGEKIKVNCQNEEDNFYLRTLIFAENQNLQESLDCVKSTALSKVESQMTDFRDLRKMEEGFLIQGIEDSWQKLQDIVNNYKTETKDRRNIYENLKKKDDLERNIIFNQVDQMAAAFEEIRKLRKRITNVSFINEKKITNIIRERNFYQEAYWIVKNKFFEEQEIDKNILKLIVTGYNQSTQHLNKHIKKLENILTISQICRKYETQDEKVVPFTTEVEKKLNWTESEEILKRFQPLENFWRRVGSAEITLAELKQERNTLREESNYLRRCLKNYLSDEFLN